MPHGKDQIKSPNESTDLHSQNARQDSDKMAALLILLGCGYYSSIFCGCAS